MAGTVNVLYSQSSSEEVTDNCHLFLCFCFVLNSLRVLEEEPPRPSVGLALPTEQRKRTAGADEKTEDSYATLL